MIRRSLLALLACSVLVAADPAPVAAPASPAPSVATVQAAPAVVAATAPSPLAPVKTDTPRDTMRSFMLAMDRYVQATAEGDRKAASWLDDAVRCLDTAHLNPVGRDQLGREAAMHLKDVIDRVITIDFDKVPATADLDRWRLRATEITIYRVAEGDRKGEYLFNPDTVSRAKDYYAKVKEMPLLPGTLGGGIEAPWQEAFIPPALRPAVFGVEYWQWILMGLLIFVGLVMRQIVRFGGFVAKRLTARTAATWDDDLVEALTGPVTHLGTTGVWFASLHLLGITGTAYTVIAFLIKGAFFVNLAYLAYKLAGFLGNQIEHRVRAKHSDINQGLLRLLSQTMKVLALLFCLLLGAQNMGMDVASLIAGLGIGGLAFALAAKDTLANLFGSIMIMFDRPFRVGDYIIAKGVEGTVEEIGFRSTRIRTVNNSLASVPNSELVLANIDNLGLRPYRRVRETYGLTYGTPNERIDAFCEGVRAILRSTPEVKQDAINVWFNALNASSLDVLVNYHLIVTDWTAELSARHNVLLRVLALADKLGVSFAYPTQTLHIGTLPGAKPTPAQPAAS
jgi:MscS family membrane protein